MSMYEIVFSKNPAAEVILATLGLTPSNVGRFRDAYVAQNEIVVYTRNGGGNRDCWHEDSPELGEEECQHHDVQHEEQTHHVCEEPSSPKCACYGCIIEYRLPQHPLYIRDVDDDFDSTYATIYFKIPEEYAVELVALNSDEPWNPSKRWLDMIERIKRI